MFGMLALAAMVSLSQAEKDTDFDKPPMNTLHDCTATPEPFGECRLPAGLTAQEIQTRLAGKRTAWWREGDQYIVVAKRDTDQAYLCCSARGRLDHIADDLWALRLRIVDLDRALINVIVEPEEDNPYDVYRGPLAPPAPVVADKLQGRVYILDVKSAYLAAPRRMLVYTPLGFDPAKKYPVVYMADGQLRGDTPGFIEPLILKGELPPMVLVATWFGMPPDGTDVLRSKEYLMDWPDGTDDFINHEDFLLKEVMPYVEKNFGASNDPKQRIITGYSSGAAWAVTMGLLHPDIFPNVIAQSMVWTGPMEQRGSAMSASMGADSVSFAPSERPTDIYARYLQNSTATRFYLSAGTLEPVFYAVTTHFADEARAAGHQVQFEKSISGHTQVAWKAILVNGLKWMFGQSAPNAAASR
jgi:enterochelin esterase-like enzyme